jgi:ubiquinone/menaquinone biosynthesis C-methylase UbiE
MEAKLQRRIQRYGWDAAARNYDLAWRENLAPAHDAMFDLADIKTGESVLDVACGSGILTFRAAQIVGVKGAVTATDISEEMVRIVATIARERGLRHVRAERMDAEALTLPAESFDAALCALGLMYMPDPTEALRQVFRTLKPGGRAVAAVWGERANCGWAELFPIVDSFVQSEVCPLFFRLGAGDALAEALGEAGFGSIRSERLSVETRYTNQREALTAMLDGGAVALAAKRFDEATRKQVEDKLLASFAPYRGQGGDFAIPGEFVVAAAIKP